MVFGSGPHFRVLEFPRSIKVIDSDPSINFIGRVNPNTGTPKRGPLTKYYY